MLASDAITYERILLATPSGSAVRWSDAQLLTLTDRAVKAVVGSIYFPESRITATTVANQQEYSLPELHAIRRVYLNGQIVVEVPGNLDTIEGRQIGYNDQGSQGALITGSSAAPGGTAGLPAWATATPVAYPFINGWGSPSPGAQPYFAGQRPRFYRRGGSIGFIPAPLGVGETITIDCVRVPTTLTTTGQQIVVPDNFLEAIANFVCYRALAADKDGQAQAASRSYFSDYQMELRKLRTWQRQYTDDAGALLPMTYRGAFKIGGNRVGGSDDW